MILVASPVGLLHPPPFCNSRIPRSNFSPSSFSSIWHSIVSIGLKTHELCYGILFKKNLRNVETMVLTSFKRRGCSSCRSGGGFHGIQIRCAQGSSEETKGKGFSYIKALRKLALCFTLAATFLMTQPCLEPVYSIQSVSSAWDLSLLMSEPPIKDPGALLRYALPFDNKPIKDIQKNLENIMENLKAPGMKGLNSAGKNIDQATLVLNKYKTEILGNVAESKKEIGKELVDKLMLGLQDFKTIVADKDRDAIASKQKELLDVVGH